MTQAEIQQYVYDFLYDKGLPHISICAVMGNITGESSWDVEKIEVGSGIGFGLCQWSYIRREQLEAYGTSLEHQCEFLWSELTGENTHLTGADYQWIANPGDSVDNGEGFYCSISDFRNGVGTIEFLTKAFCYCWERPAYATNHLAEIRIPAASGFYASMQYGGSSENSGIIRNAIEWAVSIAEDDSHGYDQTNRWSPDYDCSSFIITAYEQAGCPVKTNGATYTGDMIEAFQSCGFLKLAYTKGMTLIPGDVLWRTGHTEMYIGNGQRVGAHISENGTVYADEEGDQTGEEISVVTFSVNESWEYVLRLPSGWNPGGGGGASGSIRKRGYNFLLFTKKRRTIHVKR